MLETSHLKCCWLSVSDRPLGDSRYGTLHAGKRPVIRDGARVALRVAGWGLSRLGEGREPVPPTRVAPSGGHGVFAHESVRNAPGTEWPGGGDGAVRACGARGRAPVTGDRVRPDV